MRYGDILLAVNGFPTACWNDFLEARAQSDGQLLARVFRQGVEFELSLTLRASNATPLEVLGELQARGILPSSASSN
jgi:hypothetical protein